MNKRIWHSKDSKKNRASLHDYGARFYDPQIGRWTTLDPLSQKYYQLSPYAYVADNPVKFVDPDGKKIQLAGDVKAQNNVLQNLQKLTNDKLGLKADGSVYIISKNTVNTDKKLTFGSSLISGLSDNKDITVSISSTTKDNHTSTNKDKAAEGIPTDSKIDFNPDLREGGVDEKGGKDRNPEIGLGHELIHAKHFMNGEAKKDDTKDNPDLIDSDAVTTDQRISTEENNTRKDENEIRGEQGATKRKTAIDINNL